MKQSKQNINTLVQWTQLHRRTHSRIVKSQWFVAEFAFARRWSACCVFRILVHHLLALKTTPATEKKKKRDHANVANSQSPPTCIPACSSGVFHHERHLGGSKVKAHDLRLSLAGYFLLRRNVPVVSTPMFSGIYTPVSATAACKPIRACQWHQMANFWRLWPNIF